MYFFKGRGQAVRGGPPKQLNNDEVLSNYSDKPKILTKYPCKNQTWVKHYISGKMSLFNDRFVTL